MIVSALETNAAAIRAMIHGAGPTEHAERERLLWLLCSMYAGALTPVSENEKRRMQRVLAILGRKYAEGGAVCGGDEEYIRNHNRFFSGRLSAFRECAQMLRAALDG